MSGAEFIGLSVSVSLLDSKVEGIIVSLDSVNGIILSDAVITKGLQLKSVNRIKLNKDEILGLELKTIIKAVDSKPRPIPVKPVAKLEQYDQKKVAGIINLPSKAINGNGKTNGVSKRRNKKIKVDQMSEEEVEEAEEDRELDAFDFDAGLATFDKKSVFKLIQSQDDTDVSLRLHSHNKIVPKLLPTESVLSPAELQTQALEALEIAAIKPRSTPLVNPSVQIESDSDSDSDSDIVLPIVLAALESRKSSRTTFIPNSEPFISKLETLNSIPLAEVTLRQYKEVISITDIESSPPYLNRLLQTSHSLASLLLSHLGPIWETFNLPTEEPCICIFLGETKEKGKITIEAGIQLLNKGLEVELFLIEGAGQTIEAKNDLSRFSKAGGRVIKDLEDLRDDYELIIDCMMNNQTQNPSIITPALVITPALIAAASWLHDISLRILSLDSPFGIDHDTGAALTNGPLDPWYIACAGGVRSGIRASGKMHERDIFIVDDGIGFGVWNRVVDGFEKKRFGRNDYVGCRVIAA